MSADLIDLRAKIVKLTDVVLDFERDDTGMDRGELVRSILHDWAASKVWKATLLTKRLESKGIRGSQGESQGIPGKGRD